MHTDTQLLYSKKHCPGQSQNSGMQQVPSELFAHPPHPATHPPRRAAPALGDDCSDSPARRGRHCPGPARHLEYNWGAGRAHLSKQRVKGGGNKGRRSSRDRGAGDAIGPVGGATGAHLWNRDHTSSWEAHDTGGPRRIAPDLG